MVGVVYSSIFSQAEQAAPCADALQHRNLLGTNRTGEATAVKKYRHYPDVRFINHHAGVFAQAHQPYDLDAKEFKEFDAYGHFGAASIFVSIDENGVECGDVYGLVELRDKLT